MEYIYLIKNNVTNRRYVGRTSSPSKRFKQHFTALVGKRHPNELMQYDFERFGIDSFETEILEVSDNFTRTSAEGKWMLEFKTYDTKYGYNYKDPFVWSRHGFKTKNVMY